VSVTIVRVLVRATLSSLPLLFIAALPAPARGAEPPTAQCASAYENAQLLRQRGKLLAAREQAGSCAREQCPEIARRDCARWAEELGHEIPSVVVVVRDEADHDVAGARILVDGAPRSEVASGRALELDPGAHVFRLERPNGPPVERSFSVYQGERDRILRMTAPSQPAVPAPIAARPVAPVVVLAATSDRPSYLPTAIAAGFSIVSFAVSAYLGLTGRQELSDLRASCAPSCSNAEVDPVRTRLTFSDVALGAGLVGTVVTAYLFVRASSERSSPVAHLEVVPTLGGAAAVIGGRF